MLGEGQLPSAKNLLADCHPRAQIFRGNHCARRMQAGRELRGGGGGGHSTGDRSPAHCLLRPYLGGPCRSQHPVQAATVHSSAGASEALAHPVAESGLSRTECHQMHAGLRETPAPPPVSRTAAAPSIHAHIQQQDALLHATRWGKDKGRNKSKEGQPPLRKLLHEQSRHLSSRTSLVCASPGGMWRADGGRMHNAAGRRISAMACTSA